MTASMYTAVLYIYIISMTNLLDYKQEMIFSGLPKNLKQIRDTRARLKQIFMSRP